MKNRRPKHRSLTARTGANILDISLNASGTLQNAIDTMDRDPDQARWCLALIAWAKSSENDPKYGGTCPGCAEWSTAEAATCSLCKGIGRIRITLVGLPPPLHAPTDG